ncbi:MAG: hypothetical protein CMJ49_03030 [Planctomycetaceae bacterium]|nr:hypothetical protein [Planctomycetaceae bacterium]
MPIISKVEAKSPRGRLIYAAILLVLTLGGITMVYPFLIMVSGTMRSEMDESDLALIPKYLTDQDVIYRKFLETKYNQKVEHLNRAHGKLNFSFDQAAVPEQFVAAQADDLERFLDETSIPRHWKCLGGIEGLRTVPENLRELTKRLHDRYDGDLAAFGREVGAAMSSWNLSGFVMPDWLTNRYDYAANSVFEEYFKLDDEAEWPNRQLMSISGYFVETMLQTETKEDPVTGKKETHEQKTKRLEHYVLPRALPGADQPDLRKKWIEYVQKELNPAFVALDDDITDEDYQTYLSGKYKGDSDALSRTWGRQIANFGQVKLPQDRWLSGTERRDYVEFLEGTVQINGQETQLIEHYQLTGPEYAFRDWIEGQYAGDVNALNETWSTDYHTFAQVQMPIAQLEWQYVANHSGPLRRTYAVRNFVNVFDALFVRGRAFLNTSVFCLLSIAIALLVNPLAAYAMSRFKLPGTYKFLLILMATMSFPPMVAMIPTFIMMREMSMLNTFWALLLPAAANGYMVFLLKGFFDSLPQELYDAALIDGAGEFRMFFQITMALSKPILAVVALGAFNSAYLMFLYALIVCPAQDMWLLSVWLYQYRTQVGMGGMFASVLVAAIPPLLVFIFAQNIIMRGIVVPVEK